MLTIGVWLIAIILLVVHWQKFKPLIYWLLGVGLGLLFIGLLSYAGYMAFTWIAELLRDPSFWDWRSWATGILLLGYFGSIYAGCVWLIHRKKALGWSKMLVGLAPALLLVAVAIGLLYMCAMWPRFSRDSDTWLKVAGGLFLLAFGVGFWSVERKYAVDFPHELNFLQLRKLMSLLRSYFDTDRAEKISH